MQRVGNFYLPDGDVHFTKLGEDIEHYQEPQRLRAFELVKTWRCAIDLGAHVGIFSRHFARLFDEVVAFEPAVETRKCLERNVPDNVRIVPHAVGDREATVQFRCHLKNSGATEMIQGERTDGSGFEHYAVHMITLDSLELDGVGLVKIDVQGSEAAALRGAEQTLRRSRPVILIEEKPLKAVDEQASMAQINLCRGILHGYGYREGEKIGADRIYVVD